MYKNRLVDEKSPYLLQHAHNPVDWYPWGAEAFETARRTDKPVFLSIGYSTCHWCHVMERESFEDPETASLINRCFVPVKVDREERPDIDAVYMSVCQALTGSGGWPLTILMTPQQKPFWAGTYLPRHSHGGQPGLTELLTGVAELWSHERGQLLHAGEEITAHIARQAASGGKSPCKELLQRAAEAFSRSFDEQYGGFGSAPKFPTPHNLLFLLEYSRLERDADVLRMVEKTLVQMARGGLFDQIGGGFSRYSTDRAWLAPHFEKMLYDNALLSYVYLEAGVRTKNGFFSTVARRTLDYVLRELTGPEGEFYCGQDADSDGVEGKYYLFSPHELQELLGPEAGERFCRWYGVTEAGNFEGKSIPNLLSNRDYGREPEGLDFLRQKVYAYRLRRTRLHLDDKVLTSWNALMIAALAKAHRVLGDERYLHTAERAAAFLQRNMTSPEGRLFLRWREGEAANPGQLDDYTFLAWALLELYEADYGVQHLERAAELASELEKHFWDAEADGFFLTADDAERLITRPKEAYDGAAPSGNSVAGLILFRLWELTGETRWRELAQRQLAFLAGNAWEYPMGYGFALLAVCEQVYPSRELVCATAAGIPEGLRETAGGGRLRTLLKTKENAERLGKTAPFTSAYPIPKTGCAYYLCENGACKAPVFDLERLKEML